jgi:DNA-binding protein H-NS
MGFESVRGYVELATGLGDLTRARAKEAAHGLRTLPAAGIATGSKVAVQAGAVAAEAGALADEVLTVAVANRSDLRALVRSEVEIAIAHLGLVSAQRLEEAEAEAAYLRAEVARLRSASKAASSKAATPTADGARTAPRTSARTARPAKPAKAATRDTNGSRSAVTTRARPAGA